MTNHTIAPLPLSLLEALLRALYLANAAGPRHESSVGGTFGKVQEALLFGLAQEVGEDDARRIFEEAMDNGEDIAYNLDLLNRDAMHLS